MVKGRANTDLQKFEIGIRLLDLWYKNPSLRLGQLIENVFHHSNSDHCFYYVEDFDFIEKLEKKYGTKT
jgi:hypothetical protein